jgi:hypothetical protein
MIPTWAVFLIVVVIVVAYFLLTNTAKQRRRESIGADFAKMPDFHANQVFTDLRGETAIGIDDRGRRIAVARKGARPRTKSYSFAHIVSAEVIQNGATIATVSGDQGPQGMQERTSSPEATPTRGGLAPAGSLFGSTRRAAVALPAVKPGPGPLTQLAVRIVLRGAPETGLIVRFYEGRPIDVESVTGDRAFADARACLGALDIAIKRAGLPPRPAISGGGAGNRV